MNYETSFVVLLSFWSLILYYVRVWIDFPMGFYLYKIWFLCIIFPSFWRKRHCMFLYIGSLLAVKPFPSSWGCSMPFFLKVNSKYGLTRFYSSLPIWCTSFMYIWGGIPTCWVITRGKGTYQSGTIKQIEKLGAGGKWNYLILTDCWSGPCSRTID